MEEIEVIISSSVVDELDRLIFRLYENHYFSYIENAENYVRNIFDAIPVSIKNQRHHNTPTSLKTYGSNYVTYPSSKRTTWYIFFTKRENKILVRYISNNHTEEAGQLEHQ